MLIDCTTCVARDVGCADCVMTVLFATPARATAPPRPATVDLDESERAVLGVLAQAGLVPPLRLVRPVDLPAGDRADAYPHTA